MRKLWWLQIVEPVVVSLATVKSTKQKRTYGQTVFHVLATNGFWMFQTAWGPNFVITESKYWRNVPQLGALFGLEELTPI